jgi:ribonuclease P protein component
MRNEAHVPTEQTPPKENTWLPRPDENCRREKSAQTPPPSRPQELNPLTDLSLPKKLKLRQRSDFQRLKRQGRRLVGQMICIDWSRSSESETRLGITASKRFGGAHERNRFKRLVREAFRTARSNLPAGLDLNIVPRQMAKSAKSSAILAEMVCLLNANEKFTES